MNSSTRWSSETSSLRAGAEEFPMLESESTTTERQAEATCAAHVPGGLAISPDIPPLTFPATGQGQRFPRRPGWSRCRQTGQPPPTMQVEELITQAVSWPVGWGAEGSHMIHPKAVQSPVHSSVTPVGGSRWKGLWCHCNLATIHDSNP